jgi:hypothetical protein
MEYDIEFGATRPKIATCPNRGDFEVSFPSRVFVDERVRAPGV